MTPVKHTREALRAAAEEVLGEARAAGRRATVTALAERAGMTRPTLYRNHPGLIADFLGRAAEQHRATVPRESANQQLRDKLARLRRENEDLRRHLAIYEDHIRRLVTENTQLRHELSDLGGVSNLSSYRQRRPPDAASPTARKT